MPEYTQPEAYRARQRARDHGVVFGDFDIEAEMELADLWGLDPWGD